VMWWGGGHISNIEMVKKNVGSRVNEQFARGNHSWRSGHATKRRGGTKIVGKEGKDKQLSGEYGIRCLLPAS